MHLKEDVGGKEAILFPWSRNEQPAKRDTIKNDSSTSFT